MMGLAEARLVCGQESVVAVEIRSPVSAQSLLEGYSVSMRHHIVQDGVYCAAGEEKWVRLIMLPGSDGEWVRGWIGG